MQKILENGKVVNLNDLTKEELLKIIAELRESLKNIYQHQFDAEAKYDENKDKMTDKNKIVFLENYLRFN